jgi:hypothetical protein
MNTLPTVTWKEIQLISSTGGPLPPFPGSGPPHAHEEEYQIFSALLDGISHANPVMCELGSYWALWSLVFRKRFPLGKSILVDADLCKLAVGLQNFELNNLRASSHWAFVGTSPRPELPKIDLTEIQQSNSVDYFDVLHMDIQGAELPLCLKLKAEGSLNCIGALFIATHSESIHSTVLNCITSSGFTVWINQLPAPGGVDGTITAISEIKR